MRTPLAPGALLPGHRLQFIDAARGSAMLFVLVSHFGYSYFSNQKEAVPLTMRLVGMVASPTFAGISGLLIGFLCRTHGADFERIRVRLMDRGIFLLTVGHLLIFWSHPARLAISLFLTDTIGVCMIIGPWLVSRIQPRVRLVTSVAVYSVSWVVIAYWHPHAGVAKVFKETLFGTVDPSVYAYAFPVLPWFSLDFASSALGDRLAVHYGSGDSGAIQRLLAETGAFAFLTGGALEVVHVVAKHAYHLSIPAIAYLLTESFQKQPPSLAYFLFYGSLGLGLVSMWFFCEQEGLARRMMNYVVAIGQSSFVVFVIQWYVYFPALHLVRGRLPYAWAWPAYFVASVVVVVLPALVWRRCGYDRFVTVGYRSLWERRAARNAGRTRLRLAPPVT